MQAFGLTIKHVYYSRDISPKIDTDAFNQNQLFSYFYVKEVCL